MRFNDHSKLEGQHALLSASKYHWIRYDDEKFDRTYRTALAASRGTQLHELAAQLIRLKVKLGRSRTTLNMYVNDAIGYRLTPEVILFYSYNAFGTADAVGFKNNKLRIHDLKTGESKTSMDQLMIYSAFFCLEYEFDPRQIEIELRIYQHDDFEVLIPDPDFIFELMQKIKFYDNRIDALRLEVES